MRGPGGMGLSRAPKEHKLLFLSLPDDPSARRLRGSGRTTYSLELASDSFLFLMNQK